MTFVNPNRLQIAKLKYRQLHQGSAPFNEFLSEFIRLETETDEPVLKWKDELYTKMSRGTKEISKHQATDPDVDFAAFAQHCSRIAARLQSGGDMGLQQTTSSNSLSPANPATRVPDGPVLATKLL